MATATGRWSEAEHIAFEEGLRRFGTNWRAIARLVPTRTLVQIRTHAQKYFLKHGMPSRSEMGPAVSGGVAGMGPDKGMGDGDYEMGEAGVAGDGSGTTFTVSPVATLRHVALEPLHPGDGLGIVFATDPQVQGSVVIQGFMPVPTAAAAVPSGPVSATLPTSATVPGAGALAQPGEAEASLTQVPVAEKPVVPGAAEESDLVRIGDLVLGVSGVCVAGMDVALVNRVIAIARATTPGSIVVLHLCDVPIDTALIEEASLQMSNAAAQLLGSRQVVEAVQSAVYQSLLQGAIASGAMPSALEPAPVPSMLASTPAAAAIDTH